MAAMHRGALEGGGGGGGGNLERGWHALNESQARYKIRNKLLTFAQSQVGNFANPVAEWRPVEYGTRRPI